MGDTGSKMLKLWDGWSSADVEGPLWSELGNALLGPLSDRLYYAEAMVRKRRRHASVEPFSAQWFLAIEQERHHRQGKWIPKILEFSKHSGDTLLGLGTVLGTDWVQYAQQGARVIACSSSTGHLELIRRNFAFRNLSCALVHTVGEHLPLESASIDVVCLNSLFQSVPDFQGTVNEIYRVLKPGGKVITLVHARYDVDFWGRICLPWFCWRERPGKEEEAHRRFSARRLGKLFGTFAEHRVYKRQLRRAEVPHLWRWVPIPLLERLIGRFLVLKAFKPLSAAKSVQKAA